MIRLIGRASLRRLTEQLSHSKSTGSLTLMSGPNAGELSVSKQGSTKAWGARDHPRKGKDYVSNDSLRRRKPSSRSQDCLEWRGIHQSDTSQAVPRAREHPGRPLAPPAITAESIRRPASARRESPAGRRQQKVRAIGIDFEGVRASRRTSDPARSSRAHRRAAATDAPAAVHSRGETSARTFVARRPECMTDAFDPVIFSSVCSGLTMTSFQLLSGRTEPRSPTICRRLEASTQCRTDERANGGALEPPSRNDRNGQRDTSVTDASAGDSP